MKCESAAVVHGYHVPRDLPPTTPPPTSPLPASTISIGTMADDHPPVFCSHGAGYTVKWQDVPTHAHVTDDPALLRPWRAADASFFSR